MFFVSFCLPLSLSSCSKCALAALKDMCTWLEDGNGELAVYDATNTTRERRELIHEFVVEKYGYKLFFVESYCSDPGIIEANIKVSVAVYRFPINTNRSFVS